jgi:long-chain acyl-CoA synthetase
LAARGIGRGDRVVLACPNLPQFVVAYYAVLKLGAILVPINILLKAGEIAYHLRDCGARAFSASRARRAAAGCGRARGLRAGAGVHAVRRDRPRRKPGEDKHRVAVAGAAAPRFDTVDCAPGRHRRDPVHLRHHRHAQGRGAVAFEPDDERAVLRGDDALNAHDVSLIALPLFHSFGQSVQMNASAASGGSMVLLPRFDAEAAMRAMTDHSVTVFCGVPTMYIALLNLDWQGPDLAVSLRLGVSGGAALPVAVLRAFEQRYGVVILEGYGLSETSPVATFNHLDIQRAAGSVGVAIAGTEVGIMDEEGRLLGTDEAGEIVVRGHNVMKGYWRKPRRARRRCAMAGSTPATSAGATPTATLHRRPAQGHAHPRRLQRLPARDRGSADAHPAVAMVAVVGVPHAGARRGDQGGGAAEAGPCRWRPRRSWPGAASAWPPTSTRASSSWPKPADDRHRQDPQARTARLKPAYPGWLTSATATITTTIANTPMASSRRRAAASARHAAIARAGRSRS